AGVGGGDAVGGGFGSRRRGAAREPGLPGEIVAAAAPDAEAGPRAAAARAGASGKTAAGAARAASEAARPVGSGQEDSEPKGRSEPKGSGGPEGRGRQERQRDGAVLGEPGADVPCVAARSGGVAGAGGAWTAA